MTKPLGYWSLDYSNPLIKDIYESWGDYLQGLSDTQAYWLIGRIGTDLWDKCGTVESPSPEAEEVISRLNELTENEKIRLLQAIINK
jgi:hypothetical protein